MIKVSYIVKNWLQRAKSFMKIGIPKGTTKNLGTKSLKVSGSRVKMPKVKGLSVKKLKI